MATSREQAFERMRAAHGGGRLGHAYLVTGAPGSGKTWLTSQLGALFLSCEAGELREHPDAHFVGPESKSRRIVIDQIRGLEQNLQRTALLGSRKIAVIREADRLQPQAANAFLKTLEEPPQGTLVLLTSSLPEAILQTILSRCIEIPLMLPPQGMSSPAQKAVLDALRTCLAEPSTPSVTDAFRFTGEVREALAEVRESISKAGDEALKKEVSRYKQTTDSDWLDEREQQLKAQSEAEALRERDMILQTIFDAIASALRQQHGGGGGHEVSGALSRKFSTKELLLRLDAMERLRRRLALGVQEALALESGFLEMILGRKADG